MATEAGRAAARRTALAIMAANDWKPATLADAAGIDAGTAGDFLLGKRWPKVGTLGKIDVALELTPGTLAAIGEELQAAPEVSGRGQPFTLSEVSNDDLLAEVRRRMMAGAPDTGATKPTGIRETPVDARRVGKADQRRASTSRPPTPPAAQG